jgi:hypothetical protein
MARRKARSSKSATAGRIGHGSCFPGRGMNALLTLRARYPEVFRWGWLAFLLLLAACNSGDNSGGSGGGGGGY